MAHEIDGLAQSFGALSIDGTSSDVTFVVGGHRMPARRAVLAARSDYFREMFTTNSAKGRSNDVILKDTSPAAFQPILNYAYTDTLDIEAMDEQTLLEVLELSHRYRFLGLQNVVAAHLAETVTIETVCERLNIAELLNIDILKKACLAPTLAAELLPNQEVVEEADESTGSEQKECFPHYHCGDSNCGFQHPRSAAVVSHITSHSNTKLQPRRCTNTECSNLPKYPHHLHHPEGRTRVFVDKTACDDHSANKNDATSAEKTEQLDVVLAAMDARIKKAAQPRQKLSTRAAPAGSPSDAVRAAAHETLLFRSEKKKKSAQVMNQYLPAMALLHFSCSEPSPDPSGGGRKATIHTHCGHRAFAQHIKAMQRGGERSRGCDIKKYNLSIRTDLDLARFRNENFVVASCCYTLFHRDDPALRSHYPKCKINAADRITDEIEAFLKDLHNSGISEYNTGSRSECEHCKVMVSNARMGQHLTIYHRTIYVVICSLCPKLMFRTSIEWREHCGQHEKWRLQGECLDEPVLVPTDNPTYVKPTSDPAFRARCCFAWFTDKKKAKNHERQCTSPRKLVETVAAHIALDVIERCCEDPDPVPYGTPERMAPGVATLYADSTKRRGLPRRFASGILAEQPECVKNVEEKRYVYALVRIPRKLTALTLKGDGDVLRYVIYVGVAKDPVGKAAAHLSDAASSIARAGEISEQDPAHAGFRQLRLHVVLAQIWKRNEEDVMMLPVEMLSKEMAEHVGHVVVEKLLPCGLLNSPNSRFKPTAWSDNLRNETVALFITEIKERFTSLLNHRQEWMPDGGMRLVRNDPYAGIGNRLHGSRSASCIKKMIDHFADRSYFLMKADHQIVKTDHPTVKSARTPQLSTEITTLLTDSAKRTELPSRFALGIRAEQLGCAGKKENGYVYALVRVPKKLTALTLKDDDVLRYVVYVGLAEDPVDRADGHLIAATSSIAKARGNSEKDLADAGSGQPRLHAGLAQIWKRNEEDVMMLPVEMSSMGMTEHVEHVAVEKLFLPCGLLNSPNSRFKPTTWSDNLRNVTVALFITEIKKRFIALLEHRQEWMPAGGMRPIKEDEHAGCGTEKRREHPAVTCVRKIVEHFTDKSSFTRV